MTPLQSHSQKEINLISKGLSFVTTPDTDKTAIMYELVNVRRKLNINFYLDVAVITIVEKGTTFVSKFKWNPADKAIYPNLIQCISNLK